MFVVVAGFGHRQVSSYVAAALRASRTVSTRSASYESYLRSCNVAGFAEVGLVIATTLLWLLFSASRREKVFGAARVPGVRVVST